MGKVASILSLSELDNKKPHRSNDEINKRKQVEKSLKIAKNKLKPPQWLGEIAKTEFKYIVNQTLTIELLNNLDLHVLAVYCNTYEEYIKVSQQIAMDGPIVEANKSSETVVGAHPLYVKQYQLLQSLRNLMTDLGLSPQARAKLALQIAKDGEKEPEEFDDV